MAKKQTAKDLVIEFKADIERLYITGKTAYRIAEDLGLDKTAVKSYIIDVLDKKIALENGDQEALKNKAILEAAAKEHKELDARKARIPVKNEDLINLAKHRAKELLEMNIGDVYIDKIGETEKISTAEAMAIWEQGKKIMQAAIAEDTKIKQLERDVNKNAGGVNLEKVLMAAFNNKPAMEQAKHKALQMQQERMKSIKGKIVGSQEIVE